MSPPLSRPQARSDAAPSVIGWRRDGGDFGRSCSIRFDFIAISMSSRRTAIGLGDPDQRLLAHLGGEREDAVEQRIGGLGQIK